MEYDGNVIEGQKVRPLIELYFLGEHPIKVGPLLILNFITCGNFVSLLYLGC